ncbi:hypothetical protein N7456_007334 [Penicillium angulare]|uniref:Carrier domain-containing protein n=1 Tax=Penicillium angulare TaxID=116970 RepID=A0A9W9K860_9EURO|nr:hypothetical protein N7456_007334 [Penicillium angulare]
MAVEEPHQQLGFPNGKLFLPPSNTFRQAMAKLQTTLEGRLPRHMIPEVFIPVEAFPLTMTGKCDRRSLREQVAQLSLQQIGTYLGDGTTDTKVMPTSPIEKTLQRIWSEILSQPLENVGIHDYWTRLGGDSISAMKLVSEARTEGYIFALSEVLRLKTIHELAQMVKNKGTVGLEDSKAVRIQPFQLLGPERPSIIETIVKEYQIDTSSLEDVYPIVGLQNDVLYLITERQTNLTMRLEFQMPDDLDINRFSKAWDAAVATNPVLRTRAVKTHENNYYQAVVRGQIPLLVSDASENVYTNDDQENDIWEFGKSLFRGTLQKKFLVIQFHHFIFDGFSWPLVLQEIEKAYNGEELRSHSFVPFVQWANKVAASTRQFWREKFAGLSGLPFPPLREGGLVPVESRILKGQYPVIADDYTVALKIRMALAITISWYHQTSDILLGVASSRRSVAVPGIESVPGPTAQLLPDRIQLRPTESVESNLGRTQDEILTTMEFEQIGIRDMGSLSPDAARACQFQTVLSLQNEKDISDDSIFKNWHMPDYGIDTAWNLKVVVCMSTQTVSVAFHLSDSTLPPEIDWQKFHDQLGDTFGLIQEKPHLSVEHVAAMVFDNKS